MKHTLQELKNLGFIPIHEGLPQPNEPVIAVTPHFRCLAVRNNNGRWQSAMTRQEIINVIAWSATAPQISP